jgi:hypothetical protein
VIVERRTYQVKPFCAQAAAEFVKEVFEQIGFPHSSRIYTPIIGTGNVIYHEVEFEDFAERQAFWAAFFLRPEQAGWQEKWAELTESGFSNELLERIG